jgi:type IV fimbrial biogenesis protein FimT
VKGQKIQHFRAHHHWESVPNGGYTLVELITTVAVIALVTALAVPGMRSLLQNNRAVTEANALVGALNLARSETVTRGQPVSLCPSTDGATCADTDDWSTGWLVFADPTAPQGVIDAGPPADTVLRAYPALGEGSRLTADGGPVTYAPNGFLAVIAERRFDLEVPACIGDHNRTITVNPQGRVAVTAVACGGEDEE